MFNIRCDSQRLQRPPGRYRFLDFFRFGWPLSLAYTLMVPMLLIWFA